VTHIDMKEAQRAKLIDQVTADAAAFFEASPDRKLYAGFVGYTEDGGWVYLVMERSGPYGAFDFEPPTDEFTMEQFTVLLNRLPRGEQVMSDAVERVGGTVRAARDKLMSNLLANAPTSPTRH
jgi:hypothetical protein